MKWTSSNSKIASVSKEGYVKALKPGTATITVTYGNCTAKCKVKVTDSSAGWKKAYKSFLSKSIRFECKGSATPYWADAFCIADINKDGIPELITTDRSYCSHYVSQKSNHCHMDLWRYTGGKVKYVGGYLTKKANTYEIRLAGSGAYFKSYTNIWEGMYATRYGGELSGSSKKQSLYLNNSTLRKHFFG